MRRGLLCAVLGFTLGTIAIFPMFMSAVGHDSTSIFVTLAHSMAINWPFLLADFILPDSAPSSVANVGLAIHYGFYTLVAWLLLFCFSWRALYRSNKAQFKSRVSRTFGSVRVRNDVSSDLAIEVHLLGAANPADWIGLSFEANNRRGPQHPPIMLSRKEAADLAKLLADASQAT